MSLSFRVCSLCATTPRVQAVRPVPVSESGEEESVREREAKTRNRFFVFHRCRQGFSSLSRPQNYTFQQQNSKKVFRPLDGLVQRVPRLPPKSRDLGAGLGLRPLLGLRPRRRKRPLRAGPGLLAQRRRKRERRRGGNGPRVGPPPARRCCWKCCCSGREGGFVGAQADRRRRREERRGLQPEREGERQRRDAPDCGGRRGEEGRSGGGGGSFLFFRRFCCCFRSELFEIVIVVDSIAVSTSCFVSDNAAARS